jgi:hypothetical protein
MQHKKFIKQVKIMDKLKYLFMNLYKQGVDPDKNIVIIVQDGI